jgi:uncharacterized membrane protein (UPF0182 family)
MRSPDDLQQEHHATRSRRRVILVVAAIVVVVLLASLRSLAGLWTDQMWFTSEGKGQVFNTLLAVKVGLAVVFGLLFFAGLLANLIVADRIGRSAVLTDPDDEMVRRYQAAVRPYARRIYLALAAVFGIGAGVAAIGQWQSYLLFTHAKSFGIKDPQFGKDVGFYVFRLPFIEFTISWLLVSLILITVVTGIFHYLNGGIRGQKARPRVRPAVKVHLSVLLALIALAKAAGYFYQRYTLTTSTNGYVEGATYTDVHARLPAIELLFWLSLLAAAILLFNIWRQGWTLPVLALGIWAFVALIIGVIYPAVLQVLKVTPAQSTLELPYIARNISATRDAFNLNHVVQKPFEGVSTVDKTTIDTNAQTLANIRLWDPDPQISQQTFQKLQGLRSYYVFNSLGVDRYNINGAMTPALSGVRQLNSSDLPASSWVNSHLVYTHGTGMAVAPANTVLATGNPTFGVGDVPPTSAGGFPNIDQAGVFFGLNQGGYVVVNSKQLELDYQTTAGVNVENHYRGTGGVKINGFFRRAAFALRLGDFNLLISNLITNDSRIMFVRDIQTMAQKAAPFLSFDADPYAVLVDGHIDWVLDGYTTSSSYPYSQNASDLSLPSGSGLPGSYNYVRNSVKVVIDAYSGKMTFYAVDPKDPILQAYEAAFPGMFTPGSSIPAALRAHLRYPEDVFSAQMATYGRYHITNPPAFYNAGDAWTISQTAGAGPPSQTLALTQFTNAQGVTIQGPVEKMAPQYQVQSLPGTTNQTFVLSDAFVPISSGNNVQNLSAFMMATSDPSNYGQLTVYVTPSGQNVVGPVQADAEIQQNPTVSKNISLLDQHGSSVLLGNILMVPIDQAMLYVRPLYVTSSGNPLPQLKYVIAVYGNHVGIETSLGVALSDVLQATVNLPSHTGTGSGQGSGQTAQVAALLNSASAAYQTAQAALRSGDLAGYQTAVLQMYQDLLAAQTLLSTSSSTTSPAATQSSTSATSTTPTTTQPTTTTTTTTTKTTKANSKTSSATSTSTTNATAVRSVPASGRRS